MREFVITGQEAGGRFDKYLKRLLPLASSGFLYKMLRKKNITLNGKKAEGKERLAEKDVVKLFFSEEAFLKFAGKSGELSGRDVAGGKEKDSVQKPGEAYRQAYQRLGKIPVIYEDGDILILNKPAGILSQKAKKEDVSLNEWMIGYLLERHEISEEGLVGFRPSVCNRLDRNTSGLMLCGKTLRGSRFLSEILRDRSLHKYYLAYAQGKVERTIALKGYLKKEEKKNRSEAISEEEYRKRVLAEKEYCQEASAAAEIEKGYRKIETVIRPLSYFERGDCTKLEILLVTGKSHQIRAHLSGIGHPVLGDVKYGWKPKRKEDAGLRHQLLHACRVEFPETEGAFGYLSGLAVTAPSPELFEKLEERLR